MRFNLHLISNSGPELVYFKLACYEQ